MTKQEIKTLRDKVGTDPILTDEEIEYIWMAMDKQEPLKPDSLKFPKAEIFICPSCEHIPNWPHGYCPKCGQHIHWGD